MLCISLNLYRYSDRYKTDYRVSLFCWKLWLRWALNVGYRVHYNPLMHSVYCIGVISCVFLHVFFLTSMIYCPLPVFSAPSNLNPKLKAATVFMIGLNSVQTWHSVIMHFDPLSVYNLISCVRAAHN